MANAERTIVMGFFDRREQTERALEWQKRAGFRPDQVSFALHGVGRPTCPVEVAPRVQAAATRRHGHSPKPRKPMS
jgi:hypothetical protein